MNPGDTSNAARSSSAVFAALNEGRGVNPGDTLHQSDGIPAVLALNEGRGVNPGDTRADATTSPSGQSRSTKAGA